VGHIGGRCGDDGGGFTLPYKGHVVANQVHRGGGGGGGEGATAHQLPSKAKDAAPSGLASSKQADHCLEDEPHLGVQAR